MLLNINVSKNERSATATTIEDCLSPLSRKYVEHELFFWQAREANITSTPLSRRVMAVIQEFYELDERLFRAVSEMQLPSDPRFNFDERTKLTKQSSPVMVLPCRSEHAQLSLPASQLRLLAGASQDHCLFSALVMLLRNALLEVLHLRIATHFPSAAEHPPPSVAQQ